MEENNKKEQVDCGTFKIAGTYTPGVKTIDAYANGLRLVERIMIFDDEENNEMVFPAISVDRAGERGVSQGLEDEKNFVVSFVLTEDNAIQYRFADILIENVNSMDGLIDDLLLFGVTEVLLHDGSKVSVVEYFMKGGQND